MVFVPHYNQRISSGPEPYTPSTPGAVMSDVSSSENLPPSPWTPAPNADVKRVNPFFDATTPSGVTSAPATPVITTPMPTQTLDLDTLRMLARSGESGSVPDHRGSMPIMNITPAQSKSSSPLQSPIMAPRTMAVSMGTFPPQLYADFGDDDDDDADAGKRTVFQMLPPPPPPQSQPPVDVSTFDPLLSANGPKDLLSGSPDKRRGKRSSDPGGAGSEISNLDGDCNARNGLLQIAAHLSAIKPQENSEAIEKERRAAAAVPIAGTTLGEDARPTQSKMLSTKIHLLMGGRHQNTGDDGDVTPEVAKKGRRHRRTQSAPIAFIGSSIVGVNFGKQRDSESGKSTPKAPSSPKSHTKHARSPLRKHIHPEKLASKFAARFGKAKKQLLPQQQQYRPLSPEARQAVEKKAPDSGSGDDELKKAIEMSLPPIPVLSLVSGADVVAAKTIMPSLSLADLHLAETEHALRSSEQDPAPHQIELPRDPTELAVHVRLCRVLEAYREVDQNLDFGTFVTIDPAALKSFARSGDGSGGGFCGGGEGAPARGTGPAVVSDEGGVLSSPHRPVAKMLVDCGVDDLAVEGFFHEVGDDDADETAQAAGVVSSPAADKCTRSRVEVAVFSSQTRRQFVVVYQGTAKQQVKPVRQRELRRAKDANTWLNKEMQEGGGSKEESSSDEESDSRVVLPAQTDATVSSTFPAFRQGYFKQGLEQRVFGILKELAEKHPFFDVIFTGHSYGAALSTIGAVRYARESSTIRTSCHAFGCPRVGGHEFRSLAHSLPNLKIVRMEYGSDPWCHVPDEMSWTHVGHSVTVSSKATASSPPSTATASASTDTDGVTSSKSKYIQAYRFDGSHRGRNLAASGGTSKRIIYKIDKLKTAATATFSQDGKIDHDIQSYVAAVEAFCPGGSALSWVKTFEGEGHDRLLC